MRSVNILEARNNLSRLVSAVSEGEQIVISKRGVPVARLVAAESEPPHTAASAAEWLATHVVPHSGARDAEELDSQIATEREGWE